MRVAVLVALVLALGAMTACSNEVRSGSIEAPSRPTADAESDEWDSVPVPGTDLLVPLPPDWDEESLDDYEEYVDAIFQQFEGTELDAEVREHREMLDRGVIRTVMVGKLSGYTCWIEVYVQPWERSLADAVARRERSLDRHPADEKSRSRVSLPVATAVRLERVYAPMLGGSAPSRDIEYVFIHERESVTIRANAPAFDPEFEDLMADFMDRVAIQRD